MLLKITFESVDSYQGMGTNWPSQLTNNITCFVGNLFERSSNIKWTPWRVHLHIANKMEIISAFSCEFNSSFWIVIPVLVES